MPLEEVRGSGDELFAEAVERLRNGQVRCQGGYDGEYGVIRLFDDEELRRQFPILLSREQMAAKTGRWRT